MKKLYILLLASLLITAITSISAQTTPCTLTGGSVYIDNNTNPSMMNATVNGMSLYNYSWTDTNGVVVGTANQIPFYTQWCVTIVDNLTGCDTTICQDCTAGTAVCMCTMIYMPVCGCDGVQYANSCLADCADVPWTPAVSNGQLGGFLPCTVPSWDCNPGQGCYDPGTGSGAYTSLATCQSNCSVTPSWDCNPVQGCYDPGTGLGFYTTYNACDTACSMVNPSWDCVNGACIDPLTGQGAYTTYNSCAVACVTPTWDCVNGMCIDPLTGQGAYTTYSACNNNCIAQTWDCVNNFCFDPGTGNGAYATQGACDTACSMVNPSWDCNPVQGCYDPGTGLGFYTTYNACAIACVTTVINEEILELLIYPNPTKNILTIDGNYTSATIYDVFGKAVLTTNYKKNIDVATLISGIYFLHINTNDESTVKKITIAK